jgi:hypothetical protein
VHSTLSHSPTGLPCGKRVRWSSWGETPNGLSASPTLEKSTETVTDILANGRLHPQTRHQLNQPHRELVYRPLKFHKRSEFFFGAYDETLPVAMSVHNPNCLPLNIDCSDAAQTPTGFVEIIGDDFPV